MPNRPPHKRRAILVVWIAAVVLAGVAVTATLTYEPLHARFLGIDVARGLDALAGAALLAAVFSTWAVLRSRPREKDRITVDQLRTAAGYPSMRRSGRDRRSSRRRHGEGRIGRAGLHVERSEAAATGEAEGGRRAADHLRLDRTEEEGPPLPEADSLPDPAPPPGKRRSLG